MSDNKEEYHETGAGGGGPTPATDHGTENAVGDDMPTTPHMGDASDGGEFLSLQRYHTIGTPGSETRFSRSYAILIADLSSADNSEHLLL
jgi:hypothetical protein